MAKINVGSLANFFSIGKIESFGGSSGFKSPYIWNDLTNIDWNSGVSIDSNTTSPLSALIEGPLSQNITLTNLSAPTFTRTTTKTFIDYTGALGTAAINEATFDGGRRISEGVWSSLTPEGDAISPVPKLIMEGPATNYFLNSDTPASHTSGTVPTGTYTLWLVGSGSIAVAAGTAVGTGWGTASSSTPVVITISTGGTVAFTVSGTVTQADFATGPVKSSHIPTTSSARARAADTTTWPLSDGFKDLLSNTVGDSIAQGTLILTAECSYNILSAASAFLSVNGTVNSMLSFDSGKPLVRAKDGTIPADGGYVDSNVSTTYVLRWSSVTGTYQLSTITNGVMYRNSAVSFDGSFNPTTILELHKSMATPVKYSGLKIFNRTLTDAEINSMYPYVLSNATDFSFQVINSQVISGVFSTVSGQTITVNWGNGTSNTFSGTDQSYSKDYGSAGNRLVTVVAGQTKLKKFTMDHATANIWFDLSSIPSVMTSFTCTGSNTVTGNLSSIPSVMTFFNCAGSNIVTGNLSSLPSVMTSFACSGSNTVTGNISSLPSGITYLLCGGLSYLNGNISSLPTSLTYCYVSGSNLLTGDVGSIPVNIGTFVATGLNTIYGSLSSVPTNVRNISCGGLNTITGYSSHIWPNYVERIRITNVSPGIITSAGIDQLLIDLASVETWITPKEVYLKGTCQPRTSASDAAVSTLVSKGVTVTTN